MNKKAILKPPGFEASVTAKHVAMKRNGVVESSEDEGEIQDGDDGC